jgi:hypothetical protein
MATVKASYNVISSDEGEAVCSSTISHSLTLTNMVSHRDDKGSKLESASSIVALLSITSGELLARLAE